MGNSGFTTIDLIVLIVYLLAVLIAGLLFSKKEMQGKEFFKGDGTVPWYVTSVSIFATMLSPISFMGLPGNSYAGTWILWFAQLGLIIAVPLSIKYILPIFARMTLIPPMIIWNEDLILDLFVSFQPCYLSSTKLDGCPLSCTCLPLA